MREALTGFVLYQVDVDVPENKALAEEHGVYALPTFEVADAEGRIVGAWLGFAGPDQWADTAREETADLRPYEERLAEFDAEPTPEAGLRLARTAQARGEFAEALRLYRSLEGLDPGTGEYVMPILDTLSSGLGKGVFEVPEVKEAADRAAAAAAGDPQRLMQIAQTMGYVARVAEEPDLAVPYVKLAVEATAGTEDEDLQEARKRLLPTYDLRVLDDPDLAVRDEQALLPEDWRDDPAALNRLAWWHWQNRVALADGEKWARRAVELSAADEERANALDTLAEILAARDNAAGAVEAIDRAVALDPESEYLQKQQRKFAEAAGIAPPPAAEPDETGDAGQEGDGAGTGS